MKYQQAQKAIVDLIAQEDLATGGRLPSEDELARYCGVSNITIRRALQELGSLGIIERIQGKGTFVKRPPAGAAPLGTVAMVVTGRDPHMYEGMLGTAQRALLARGFTARFVVATDPSTATARELATASGVLISGMVTDAWIHFFESLAMPFVVVGSCQSALPVWRVDADWAEATRLLVRRLHQRGCRQIGFINGARRYPPALRAYEGFREAMAEAGLDFEERWVTWCQRGEYYQRLRDFFEAAPEPLDAIVVEQGIFPVLLTWFFEHGVPKPRPLLGVGTSRPHLDGEHRSIVHAGFSVDLTQRGVERLFDVMGNHREPPRTEWLQPTLIGRTPPP